MLKVIHTHSVLVATIALEGKLLGPWVDEARRIVDAARSEGDVRLNLGHLSYADPAGVALLRSLAADGVSMHGGSPFIQGLLAAPAAAKT